VLLVERSRPPDSPARHGSQEVRYLPVSTPFCAPAALNQLLHVSSAPCLLLLESGAIVTQSWLGRLLDALQNTDVGLSGPSTNTCWNEQQVDSLPDRTQWSLTQIEICAASVATRYANQRYPMNVLHNLADFCYLFKRSVAEALGGFNEAYGAGPCWEIDFTTRAACAGFQALWVADAYVHRTSAASWHDSDQLFIDNKRLYQDRFCGLRLRGEKTNYELHCRGGQCEHFAPPELIQVKLEASKPRLSQVVISSAQEQRPRASIQKSKTPPLVSCIMPTRNRRPFIAQALAYFEQQDYPNRELIVVDDGEDKIEDLVSSHPGVRYQSLPKQASIGTKRNIACQLARGAIIAHWDDDDWYAPYRLSYQIEPLLTGQSDLIGLETYCFFDLSRWEGWTCTPDLHSRLFVWDVHGGTLVYWRWIWERYTHYPSMSLAEDASFLVSACIKGARMQRLPHARSFVYIRHESNAWRFPLGTYISPAGWQKMELDSCMPSVDLDFYKALRRE
jgi:GT2 family glycosyltransferase